MKICVLLADGFEEVEAIAPIDLLRRAGFDVTTIAIKNKEVVGSHGITVIADKVSDEVSPDEFDAAILPGGMPGSLNLDSSAFVDSVINAVLAKNGNLAAICAAPMVLGHRGLLEGKDATCFPGFEKELFLAKIKNAAVVTDGKITTANGMESALEFGKELVKQFSKSK